MNKKEILLKLIDHYTGGNKRQFAQMIGISPSGVSTWLLRHTFATYMLRHGVKIENLQRMLGHSSIVTTQRYAKVLAQSVRDDYDAVEAQINKKEGKG